MDGRWFYYPSQCKGFFLQWESTLWCIALHSVTSVRKLPITQSCRKSSFLSKSKITYYEYCTVNLLSWLLNKRQSNQRNERSHLTYEYSTNTMKSTGCMVAICFFPSCKHTLGTLSMCQKHWQLLFSSATLLIWTESFLGEVKKVCQVRLMTYISYHDI